MPPYLSDSEVDGICRPLTQHFAQIRFLRRIGLRVERRPDGSPLVWRNDWERQHNGKPAGGPKWSKVA
ncbi:DUF4224 domain-containing protein [Methylibium sp.]|uniref:DUF4224 domain-containing protein n=1 Tax=Methylibium sp. TaxID=2067992 RepID=UPI0017FC6F4B|nr:DUF4224 domain-containing protein [Methylibium sp.]MBA3588222.1 DUF4224 domain-containing protein [Methylibium sp.]